MKGYPELIARRIVTSGLPTIRPVTRVPLQVFGEHRREHSRDNARKSADEAFVSLDESASVLLEQADHVSSGVAESCGDLRRTRADGLHDPASVSMVSTVAATLSTMM
jgi:hypothetical protein